MIRRWSAVLFPLALVAAAHADGPLHFSNVPTSNDQTYVATDPARPSRKPGPKRFETRPDTALHVVACERDAAKLAAQLDEHGDPDVFGRFDATPLMVAARCGSVANVRLLLEHGARVNARDERDMTALHHVAGKRGNDEIVRLLIDAGANVDVRNDLGQTPLHLANMNRNASVVELLLWAGANPNVPDQYGRPAVPRAKDGSLAINRVREPHP